MEPVHVIQVGTTPSVMTVTLITTAPLAPRVLIVGMATAMILCLEMGNVFARQAGPFLIVLIVPLVIMDWAVIFARIVMMEVAMTESRGTELVLVFPDGNCLIAWIVCPIILGQLAGSVRTVITESVTIH